MGQDMTVRVIRVARLPNGLPEPSDFVLTLEPAPEPAAGEVVIRPVYLKLDPYLRYRLIGVSSLEGAPIFGGPLMPGDRVGARGVGVVVASGADGHAPGDIREGEFGWADLVAVPAAGLIPIDPRKVSLRDSLGVLGGTGMTAYFAMRETACPKPGQTVVLTAAAGGVGLLAGQIARIMGARVVGIVGEDEKCAYLLNSAGFASAVNRRSPTFEADLDGACPDGVDVFLDSIGGPLFDSLMARMNPLGRIVQLGTLASVSGADSDLGQRHLYRLTMLRLRHEGFLTGDHTARFPEARAQLATWLADGSLVAPMTVIDGLEKAPEAFAMLLTGGNIGKLLLQVSADPFEPTKALT